MPQCLIIGAGVAGAAAAQELSAHDWTTTLLDKARSAGGRCATRRIHGGAWADHGAQYFTARDRLFRRLVDQELAAGRLCRWQPATCTAERRGGGWRVAASPDRRERLTGPSGLNDWVAAQVTASGAALRPNANVSRLTHDGGWRAGLDGGGAYGGFDALILALAPAPASDLLRGSAPPSLALDSYRMSPCHALVVRAPGITGCEAMFVRDGPLGWLADNSSKPGQPRGEPHLWTLHASAVWSAAHFDDARETVIDAMAETFADMTGFDRGAIEPVHHQRWRHARPGPDTPAAPKRHLYDARTRLAVAGDWLAGGRVEGAWLSGRAAAQAVLAG